jgi:hypothetical protein
VRVSQAIRTELERLATAEKRTVANFGDALLECGFEQWKVVGSAERLNTRFLLECLVAKQKG